MKLIKALLIGIFSALAITASGQENEEIVKSFYSFDHKKTPETLITNRYVVYSVAGNNVSLLTGTPLLTRGKKAVWTEISPANNHLFYVNRGNTGNEGGIFGTGFANYRVKNLKPKIYGNILSGTYAPDARRLIVGNDKNVVFTVETRKYEPVDTMHTDIAPAAMAMSSNAYYLAISDGETVVVYNFEEKRPRATWKFESPVRDIMFNNDATEFSVLTADGLVSVYDTRNFLIKRDLDNLGDAIAIDYNPDGKWMAAAVSDTLIKVINVLNPAEFINIEAPEGHVSDVAFFEDVNGHSMLAFPGDRKLNARRLWQLSPYYGKLIREQADAMMNDWLKMMPGETLEQYRARVNDESRRRQRLLFEAEAARAYANDLASMASVTLGKYDRGNQLLEVGFDNMPSIYLPVGHSDVKNFKDAADLEFRNSKYGVMGDDKFELIYAEVYNRKDGKTYIYDNLERASLNFMADDDNMVSIEVLEQQQMEAQRLEALRQKVLEEAKSRSIISDNTNITVNTEVIPDYDANGKRILNYKVTFSYDVAPEFSAQEDFAPGKYHVGESGAASSMLRIVKEAMEGDFSRYTKEGKKLVVNITGTADAMPIRHAMKYDGAYGEYDEEPVWRDGKLSTITVNTKEGIASNEQLAFVRAAGVRDYLENNVGQLGKMNTDYRYNINVAEGKGGEYRRITAEFLFVDANL